MAKKQMKPATAKQTTTTTLTPAAPAAQPFPELLAQVRASGEP